MIIGSFKQRIGPSLPGITLKVPFDSYRPGDIVSIHLFTYI